MRPLTALLLAGFTATAAAESNPKIAVLDFGANGASKELASAVGGVVANELERLGVFKVITTDSIRDMLALERQRQMVGCSDSGCLAEIGGALGVDYLVSGRVTKLGGTPEMPGTFSLEMTLSNVKKATREGSSIETARSETELMSLVGKGARKIVQKILAGRSGGLLLTCSEVGAVVKVDDVVKGTTPLSGRITLAGGPHLVSVEKQGFVAFQKDVQVQANGVVEDRAIMVPSPDFIQDYESRASKMRMGAWVSTGAAIAGLGTAGFFQWRAGKQYGNESHPASGTFLAFKQQLLAGDETARAGATRLKAQVQASQTLSYVVGGAGAAAAIGAAYLWIAGDNPHQYSRFHEAAVSIGPRPDGVSAAVALEF